MYGAVSCLLKPESMPILLVSDYVPDVVMSSLKTCNVNCRGPLREEGGRVKGWGWAVYHHPGTSVDEYSHREYQGGISRVKSSKGKEDGSLCEQKGKGCKEGMGKLATDIIHKM